MPKLLSILAATTFLASSAWAADKPIVAPAPAWVRPVPLPPAPPKDDAAVKVLLTDEQVRIGEGEQSFYVGTALAIQNPQGLAAGNLSLPWRPELDTLTVHKIHIRRGAEIIDVLASGQTFTVARREPNLDSAMLDGVLTANIQPEGLQVGDILDVAFSITSRDPTLKGHGEYAGASWNGFPIERAHLRIEWPSGRPVRIKTSSTLPTPKLVKSGATHSAEVSLEKVTPAVAPKGAPPRYQIGRLFQASDFANWSDLSRLLAPLYQAAAVIPASGPLRAELEKIRAIGPDPTLRAEAALALVQDRIRYVALAMGEGGLVPANAETTWSRRFGDCKGKSVLLLALLKELGIKAEPVAVNTALGDGMNERLPMVGQFNHVIVRAEVGGRTVWMDGTRVGDTALAKIAVPAFGWGLPLTPEGSDLVRLMPAPLNEPAFETTIELDAREGISLPAPAKVETVMRGDDAVTVNLQLGNLSEQARDQALRDYWKDRYEFIDAKTTATKFDARTRELRLTLEGVARMDWSGGMYQTDGTGVGYKADFSREKQADPNAPYAVPYPIYSRVVERILLPDGFAADRESSAATIDETVAGIEYKRSSSLKNDVFTIETTQRSVAPEFPAAEAQSAEKRLRELADKTISIRRPATYRPTEKEFAALMDQKPTTLEAFLERGNQLLDRDRFDEAWKDFDAALAIDPRNGLALALRGLAATWKRDFGSAKRDFDAAFAIEPNDPVLFRGRGLLALRQRAYADAVQAFTTSLTLDPGNAFALSNRAYAYRGLGEGDKAIEDATAVLKRVPTFTEMGWLRFGIYRERNQLDRAFASLEEMIAGAPSRPEVLVTAANAYARAGNQAAAMRTFDRALVLKREPWIYLNRANSRPDEAFAEREADLDAALALDGGFQPALTGKAELMMARGAYADAVRFYTTALEKTPNDPELLGGRGVAQAKAGSRAEAERDFAAARRGATTADALNNLCWHKTMMNVALETALAECDAALTLSPDSNAVRDSRGMTLLRLGRVDEALAEFDKVLANDSRYPTSHMGRSLAYARRGDMAKADAELAEALKLDPNVEKEFRRYGLAR